MKVLTKHGALEKLKEYLDTLWEWSVRLYWMGCKYIGIALGKFKEKYELNKRFRYFIKGLGIICIVFLAWGMIGNLYHSVVHADSGYYLDTNHDGRQIITIDAGHGHNTDGKRAYNDAFREWDINNKVANQIEQRLESTYGVEVIRLDDVTGATDVSLGERLNGAVRNGSDLHISIHQNSFDSNVSGVETFYSHMDNESRNLAGKITNSMAQKMMRNDRGAKGTDVWNLYIPREMQKQGIPSVLCEGLNMNNPEDVRYMMTQKYVDDYSEAVIESIVRQYNLIAK